MRAAEPALRASGGKPSRRSAKGATRKKAAQAPRLEWDWAQWFNRGLIVCALLAVGGLTFKGLEYLRAIPVEQIVVKGKLEYTRSEAVQQMIQPALVGGFLSADLSRVQAQLEALPWIYTANVRRRWPSTLEIHVVEQLPIARWGENGLLNHEGEIFYSEANRQREDLPALSGPDASAEMLIDSYHRLVATLRPLGLAVQSLQIDERGQIEVGLAGGMRLLLGNTEFYERMERFAKVYRSDLAVRGAEVERVDLRYQSGLAVAFKPVQEKEPSQVAGL